MTRQVRLSPQTRNNWWIDTAVFVGALLSMLTGIYFLYLPSGGKDGSGNIWHSTTIILGRETWEDLHTWGGLLMIGSIAIHLILHWRWIKMTAKRLWQKTCGENCRISRGAWKNIIVDGLIAVSFLVTAVSGLYFYFFTSGGYQGGRNPSWDPGLLFSRPIWDLLHTWAGIVLTVMAVLHIFIHWRWIVNVTGKVVRSWQPAFSTN